MLTKVKVYTKTYDDRNNLVLNKVRYIPFYYMRYNEYKLRDKESMGVNYEYRLITICDYFLSEYKDSEEYFVEINSKEYKILKIINLLNEYCEVYCG